MTHHIVGRDAELRILAGPIDRARDGGGALVLRGDPGTGKSVLLRATAGHARAAGLEVMETSGVQTEALLPFAGLHRLLRPVLGAADVLPVRLGRALLAAFGDEERAAAAPFLSRWRR